MPFSPQWKKALAAVRPITASKAPGKRGTNCSNPMMMVKTAKAMNRLDKCVSLKVVKSEEQLAEKAVAPLLNAQHFMRSPTAS